MYICFIPDVIHKFVRDKYFKRFPELESLVPISFEYMRTVKVRSLLVQTQINVHF